MKIKLIPESPYKRSNINMHFDIPEDTPQPKEYFQIVNNQLIYLQLKPELNIGVGFNSRRIILSVGDGPEREEAADLIIKRYYGFENAFPVFMNVTNFILSKEKNKEIRKESTFYYLGKFFYTGEEVIDPRFKSQMKWISDKNKYPAKIVKLIKLEWASY